MKKYFCLANTAEGFVNLTSENVKEITKIYSIKSNIKASIDALMRKVGGFYEKLDIDVEYIVSPIDLGLYSGVIIRKAGIAAIDIDLYPDGKTVVLDKCVAGAEENDIINNLLHKMHEEYKKAKQIHDDWEKIYIQNMNMERLNKFSAETIEFLLNDKKVDKKSKSVKRFFGASAPGGSVNYINLLTREIKSRYFIKGRPGTGKSTFLKKLAKEAEKRGFDTEIYCCSFDPGSLDMVIVRELDFCVFDSTAPHELFPMNENDYILDFYEESGLNGVDEKYSKELEIISDKYSDAIKSGVEYLAQAAKIHTIRERILSAAIDYAKIDEISKMICVD